MEGDRETETLAILTAGGEKKEEEESAREVRQLAPPTFGRMQVDDTRASYLGQ